MRLFFLSFVLMAMGACDPVVQHLGALPKVASSSANAGSVSPANSGGFVITITQRSGGSVAVMDTGGVQAGASGGGTTSPPVATPTGGTVTDVQPPVDCNLVQAEIARAQLVLVVDTSFSISINTLNPVAEGLSSYARDPRSAGSDMALFVLRNTSCGIGVYQGADIGLGMLPNHASAIEGGVPPVQVNLLTQPEEAVGAALDFASPLVSAADGNAAAVGLLTDGLPFGFCTSSTPAALLSAITSAQQASPAVETYLISLVAGVFNPSNWSAGATPDELAAAGGTGQAYSANVASAASPGDSINMALQQVRADLQPCTIRIDSGTKFADMRISLSGGAEIPQVGDASDCGNSHGYYLVDPGDWLAGASLCPPTCELVKSEGIFALELGSKCP